MTKKAKPTKCELFERARKPSRMIQLALEDYDAVVKSKKYMINMGDWHEPQRGINKEHYYDSEGVFGLGKDERTASCSVCFAGSVMANRYNVPANRNTVPRHFGPETESKFLMLNGARSGEVQHKGKRYWMPITHHHEDPILWRQDMDKFVAYLKEKGV